MKLIRPKYCRDFKCLGSECSDNCCIGWEIDVDDIAYAKYKKISHILSKPIESVTEGSPPHFILGRDGRCPYLREDNLCEIICKVGEGYLCDICKEHPRYYNSFPGFIEGGIGLACEEAARLILTSELPIEFVTEEVSFAEASDNMQEIYGDENEDECPALLLDFAFEAREQIYKLLFSKVSPTLAITSLSAYADYLSDTSFDIEGGLCDRVPEDTGVPIYSGTEKIEGILSRFSDTLPTLEALTDDLLEHAESINSILKNKTDLNILISETIGKQFKSLLFYFIHRYFLSGVYDSTLGERLLFSVCSALSIAAVAYATDSRTLPDLVNIAKGYSKNLEYSTENVDRILDALSIFT